MGRVIRRLFPVLFKTLDVESLLCEVCELDKKSLLCEVCELAKHKRVHFPVSNKMNNFPFYLVHIDVWDPSNIIIISNARWS